MSWCFCFDFLNNKRKTNHNCKQFLPTRSYDSGRLSPARMQKPSEGGAFMMAIWSDGTSLQSEFPVLWVVLPFSKKPAAAGKHGSSDEADEADEPKKKNRKVMKRPAAARAGDQEETAWQYGHAQEEDADDQEETEVVFENAQGDDAEQGHEHEDAGGDRLQADEPQADEQPLDEVQAGEPQVVVPPVVQPCYVDKDGQAVCAKTRRQLYPNGCSRCRKVAGCTRSCWKKRWLCKLRDSMEDPCAEGCTC